jgi:hypothetical protein
MPITNAASKFFTESVDLTSTNQTTIYTVPNNHSAVVKALIIANTDTSNRNIDLKWYHADDATTHSILEGHQVTGSNFEAVLNDNVPLYLHAGCNGCNSQHHSNNYFRRRILRSEPLGSQLP